MDRGEIVIKADEWPAFLYDEDVYDGNREWVGLFLGETFVRVSLAACCSIPLIDNNHRRASTY